MICSLCNNVHGSGQPCVKNKVQSETPPMPGVRAALCKMADARAALSRHCWNKDQVLDALNSAEYFIELARKGLQEPVSDDSK
jgi:hypothetical protein